MKHVQVQRRRNFKVFFWKERSERWELSMESILSYLMIIVDYGALGASVRKNKVKQSRWTPNSAGYNFHERKESGYTSSSTLWVASSQKNLSNNMAELPIDSQPQFLLKVTHVRYAKNGHDVGQNNLRLSIQSYNPRTSDTVKNLQSFGRTSNPRRF